MARLRSMDGMVYADSMIDEIRKQRSFAQDSYSGGGYYSAPLAEATGLEDISDIGRFGGGIVTISSQGIHIVPGSIPATKLTVLDSLYPVVQFTRTSPATTGGVNCMRLVAQSEGDMTDGFGSGLRIAVEDDAGVINDIAEVHALRFTADNTGQMIFSVADAGVMGLVMALEPGLVRITGTLNLDTGDELTISSGEITMTKSYHRVDTESDASSDNLDTINGGLEGDILVIRAQDNGRTIVVRKDVGNLNLGADGDFSMDHVRDTLTFMNRGDDAWIEISRSNNSS